MKWTVTCRPSAVNELADIWNHVGDKQAVSKASDCIEDELKVDADRKGKAYDEDRIIVIYPLVAVYSVSPDDCLVTILHYLLVDD